MTTIAHADTNPRDGVAGDDFDQLGEPAMALFERGVQVGFKPTLREVKHVTNAALTTDV